MARNNSKVRRMTGMCVIASLVMALFPSPGDAAKMMMVGTADIKNSLRGKWLTLVFTEAFRRLGYELQYDGYPAARASALSDAGTADGEISRVFEYQTTHPNLIRVDEVLYATNFVAFAVKPGIAVRGWQSLKNTTYSVEYRRGVDLCERELPAVVAAAQLSNVTTAEQGLKRLVSGRTVLYVDVDFTTVEAMKRLNQAEFDVSAVYQAGVMQAIAAYAYLHRKNASLVPKLSRVLKAMKQEGLFESYRKSVWKQP